VGEPLRWSDIVPGWSEEDDGDGEAGWPVESFPAGSAWGSSRAAAPALADVPAPSASAVPAPSADQPAPEVRATASSVPEEPAASGPSEIAGLASGRGISDAVALRAPEAGPPVGWEGTGYAWEIAPPGATAVPARSSGSAPAMARRPRSLAPPAWVLPAEPEARPGAAPGQAPEDPLARLGVSESWSARSAEADREDESEPSWAERSAGGGGGDESGLSGAGAFGERKGGRMGLWAFDPGRRGVRALAVVAVLVIVVAAFLAWRARPRVDPVATPVFQAGSGAADGPAVAPSATGSTSAEVIVAVEGKVRKPGVVHLRAGARVADALDAAGGPEPGVDVAMLNLARKVVDGELILVGVTPPPGTSVPAAAVPGATTGGLVNLNTATLADLDTLPGVGPVLAQRILDARTAQGGFKAVSDLRKVDGIGDARYEQLKDLVTV
jgi:competence protein ComEA